VFAVSAAAICWGVATAGEVALCGARNTLKASGNHKGLIILKEVVKEGTRSAVKVELYSDAFLGDGGQMGEGVQVGTVEMMMFAQVKYVNCAPEHGSGWPPQGTLRAYRKFIEGISERCGVDCQGPMR
jgi:TRAP-type C4-dicarboxylate transport system substrate-binding protein